jgi:nucleotide-binding universal stress UspA family protein
MAPSSSPSTSPGENKHRAAPSRIAVGIDGYTPGQDAAVLGRALAAAGADLMLISVHPDPLVVMPGGMSWKGLHKETHDRLAEVRDAFAPKAGLLVATDSSVARGLERALRSERRDLLVVGSSRKVPVGHIGIGKRTRQLLGHAACPLAIAPLGLHEHPDYAIERVGVGYDGGPESSAALELAAATAHALGAELIVRAVVDDRVPVPGWARISEPPLAGWPEAVADEVKAMRERLTTAIGDCGVAADGEVLTGRPADALRTLCDSVDLLVIGSRHWGPVSRLFVGSTGEAMMRSSSCPLLLVPRPDDAPKQD